MNWSSYIFKIGSILELKFDRSFGLRISLQENMMEYKNSREFTGLPDVCDDPYAIISNDILEVTLPVK